MTFEVQLLSDLYDSNFALLESCEKHNVEPWVVFDILDSDRYLKNIYFKLNGPQQGHFYDKWQTLTQRDGFVYFIFDKVNNALKIGFSKQPFKRVKRLQTGNAAELELVQYFRANTQIEAMLHRRFKKYRMSGEWFRLSPDIMRFVRAISES